MPTLHCDQCHAPFHVPQSHVNKRRFCTPACRAAQKATQDLTCQICGVQFHVPPSVARRVKCCSIACGAVARLKPIAGRFWSKVDKDGPVPSHCPELGPCWRWMGGCDENGYGRLSTSTPKRPSLYVYAHRVAWELANGPITEKRHVLHRCDNASCVNSAHLFLGTQPINNADRDAKDRVRHGEQHPYAKLTVAQVHRIRTLAATGVISRRGIARALEVPYATVNDVLAGKTWRRA